MLTWLQQNQLEQIEQSGSKAKAQGRGCDQKPDPVPVYYNSTLKCLIPERFNRHL